MKQGIFNKPQIDTGIQKRFTLHFVELSQNLLCYKFNIIFRRGT